MAFALTVCLAAPAAAQVADEDRDEQARTHFESGEAYFNRGDYESALREFRASLELSGRPLLYFNIYTVSERLGRLAEAAEALERFLASGAESDPRRRSDLQARLSRLRERARQGGPAEDAEADGGLGSMGIVGVVGLATGGAALATFAIVGGLATAEDARLAADCGRDAGRVCTDAEVGTLETMSVTADVMLAAGLVVASAGAVFLLLDLLDGETEEASLTVLPAISPDSLGVVIGGAL